MEGYSRMAFVATISSGDGNIAEDRRSRPSRPKLRPKKFTKVVRRKAMLRAGYRCERVGCYETEGLTLHHIDRRSNMLHNALVLCTMCHFWKHHTIKRHHKNRDR